MNESTRYLRIFFVLFGFGLISLFVMLGRPSMAAVRAVDVVQLLGSGMCFGGAIFALVAYFRDRRSRAITTGARNRPGE